VSRSYAFVVAGMLGLIGGAALIDQWAIGVAVMVDSVVVGVYGVLRDQPEPDPADQVRRRTR
jgi:hypothetical protein